MRFILFIIQKNNWEFSFINEGSLSSMCLKVHGSGLLCQTQVRISKTSIIYYRMEELISLHYGNFTILGKRAKKYTQRMGCSNRVADQALQCQLLLAKIRKEHKQEWSMFFLEWMFHNAVTMQCTECIGCSRGLLLEVEETAPGHPSVQALVGSQDSDILRVIEQIYRGEYSVTPCVLINAEQEELMRELWWELSGQMTRAGLQSKRGTA